MMRVDIHTNSTSPWVASAMNYGKKPLFIIPLM